MVLPSEHTKNDGKTPCLLGENKNYKWQINYKTTGY
jgi:hypothetical protein